jgi:glycosyltransferase involved in cell wall biosynthesis
MVDISVVIAVCPAHHRDSLLGRCLRGVAEQTFGRNRCEVILVGDGVELDPSLVPPGLSARCYSFPSPVGLTRVRNQCLRLASAELVAFLDADAVPHPDWLLCLHDRLTEEGAAGLDLLKFFTTKNTKNEGPLTTRFHRRQRKLLANAGSTSASQLCSERPSSFPSCSSWSKYCQIKASPPNSPVAPPSPPR